MPTITPTIDDPALGVKRTTFTGVATGDTILPALIGAGKTLGGTVHMSGTWGSATVSLRASIDGTNFFILEDTGGDAITLTDDGYAEFSTAAPYLDVAISGGTSDSVTIAIALAG